MAFLRKLYASTRADEMAQVPWDQADVDAFLTQQFNAQHDFYQAHHPDADYLVIEADGEPIGRAYLLWTASHLQIIDIALLPAHRARGIGGGLLRQWLERADRQGLSVGLYVEGYNPAQRLYQRNGFEVEGENGVYLKMRRPAMSRRAAVHG
ncbi:GNAT family N-acetyltransferase [Pseudomonas sp. NY15181]|uniref:GNAT family N-acetyltransferase n=1 Tax=Pseudomonas sp. NY15181 TaxID=3400349 RepID=UPI003A85F6FF